MTTRSAWERCGSGSRVTCCVILFDPRGVLRRKLQSIRSRLRELGSRRIELADGSWYWDLKPDMRPGEIVTL